MASRYHTKFSQLKTHADAPPKQKAGHPGDEKKGLSVKETPGPFKPHAKGDGRYKTAGFNTLKGYVKKANVS